MTKLNAKVTVQVSEFVGKSAKQVREIGLSDVAKRANALAYAVSKQSELSAHPFRGQLWAQTVAALSGKPVSAKKAKPSAEPSKEEILAQIQALTALLTK